MRLGASPRVQTGLRVLLGCLFLWAAVGKLANPTDFLGSVYAYQVPFPKILQQVVTVILPWIEFFCGFLLLTNIWSETALAIASFLMVVFLLATGQAWIRGLTISCGCFSFFGLKETSPNLVKFLESVGFAFFRNLILTAAAVFLLRARLLELRDASVGGPDLVSGSPDRRITVPSQADDLPSESAATRKLTRKQRKRLAAAAR
jgi:putative oxidoreductase